MKKVSMLVVVFTLSIVSVQAQTAEQPWGFKVGFGVQSYRGDLGNEMLTFAKEDYVYGLGLAYYINEYVDIALDARWMSLDRYNGPDNTEFILRNTFFSTNVFNMNLMAHIKPFQNRLNPYIAIGIGPSIFKDASNVRKDETYFLMTLPFGIGVNYEVNDRLMFNLEGIYNRSFSDKIDNYPLSTGQAASGISPRQDHDGKNHDDFFTLTVGIVYNFGGGDQNSEEDRMQRLTDQAMTSLQQAHNLNEDSHQALQQAHALNDKTLDALDQLQKARGMSNNQKQAMEKTLTRIINNVQFGFDKSSIIPPAKTELRSLASIMKEYTHLDIHIAAYADKRGNVNYNNNLAKRRAQSVKDFLSAQGVNIGRITTSIFGEEQSLMQGNTQTAYAQNRAVQITLSYNP